MVFVRGHRHSGLSALLSASALLFCSAASAADLGVGLKDKPAEANKFEWSAYVQGTSDYIFRGISQTKRDPTLQGGVDLGYGIFYAGTFVSGLNFIDRRLPDSSNPVTQVQSANVEIDLYAGIKPKWGDVTFDFGVIWYTYPHSQYSNPRAGFAPGTGTFAPEYVELKAGASATILKDVSISGTVFWSPDYAGETGSAVTFEGTVSKPVFKSGDIVVALSGTVGATIYDEERAPRLAGGVLNGQLNDYVYYNAGATITYKDALSFDLRYHGTSLDSSKDPAELPAGPNNRVFQSGDTVVGTAKVAF